ncbi:MAG: ompA [Flavipsychrobacter sp.]|jgi:outer membrane protein OmpA-like peptidoglycan-associated protein/tetratricopeptide (TPR) repeat protein|nr:ompA [Flavipsychrobacter sp.]
MALPKLLFVVLVFFVCNASAKDNKDLIRAQYYYTHCAYNDAIPYYEKVAADVNTSAIYAELGDCYYITNNFSKASESYNKAVNTVGCSAAVTLRYAQLLMQLMQYDEAQKWLMKYQETYKNDKRVANLIAGCNTARQTPDAIPPGAVALLPFNTDGSDFAPALWKGRLVFASDTAIDTKKKKDYWTGRSYYNIYFANCDKGNCTPELQKLSETKKANIKYHDGPATFSADGKQMYFTRTKYNDNFFAKKTDPGKDSFVLLEVMIASDYDTATKQFKTITPFQHNSDDHSVAHPALSPNGKLLAFTSNMKKGQGGSDIYICKKMGGGSWSKPQNVGNLVNTEGEELFPYWADNETLYFSSDGHEGIGGLDIYKCKWDEKSNTFSAVENVGTPVNSSYDDISLAMFADGKSAYLSSNRPAVKGGDNIYYYRKVKIYFRLNVIDSLTRQPLPEVQMSLSSAKDKKDEVIQGDYFTQLYPDASYEVNVSKVEYGRQSLFFNATTSKDIDTIVKEVVLYKPVPVRVRKKDTIATYLDSLPISFEHKFCCPMLHNIYQIGHIYFAYDSHELTDTAKWVLDSLVSYLQKRPAMRIEVRAHTDCRGVEAYNIKLSNERSLSVVKYLVSKGVARKRLEYIGLGYKRAIEDCPDCSKCSEEQYYLHRVLEFKVLQL